MDVEPFSFIQMFRTSESGDGDGDIETSNGRMWSGVACCLLCQSLVVFKVELHLFWSFGRQYGVETVHVALGCSYLSRTVNERVKFTAFARGVRPHCDLRLNLRVLQVWTEKAPVDADKHKKPPLSRQPPAFQFQKGMVLSRLTRTMLLGHPSDRIRSPHLCFNILKAVSPRGALRRACEAMSSGSSALEFSSVVATEAPRDDDERIPLLRRCTC